MTKVFTDISIFGIAIQKVSKYEISEPIKQHIQSKVPNIKKKYKITQHDFEIKEKLDKANIEKGNPTALLLYHHIIRQNW